MVGFYVVVEALCYAVGLCLGICFRVSLMFMVVFYCYIVGTCLRFYVTFYGFRVILYGVCFVW